MDILRRLPLIDADADEGPACVVGVKGGVMAFSGINRFSGVWFGFLRILPVSCKMSGGK